MIKKIKDLLCDHHDDETSSVTVMIFYMLGILIIGCMLAFFLEL